jgi:hypothetical protein
MATTKVRIDRFTVPQESESNTLEIFEVRNITLKEAIQMVRSLATVSQRSAAPQTESDHSK